MDDQPPTLAELRSIRSQLSIPDDMLRTIKWMAEIAEQSLAESAVHEFTRSVSEYARQCLNTDQHLARIMESCQPRATDGLLAAVASIQQPPYIREMLQASRATRQIQENILRVFPIQPVDRSAYRQTPLWSKFQTSAIRGFFDVHNSGVEFLSKPDAAHPAAQTVSREIVMAGDLAVAVGVSVSNNEGELVGGERLPLTLDASLAERVKVQCPDLLHQLTGALRALHSGSPDMVRQLSVSLREFLKGLVNHGTEESEVRAWVAAKTGRNKGGISFPERIAFHFRACPNEGEFFSADIKSVDELLKVLNHGVHERERSYTDKELRYFVRRVQGFALAFLELKNDCM